MTKFALTRRLKPAGLVGLAGAILAASIMATDRAFQSDYAFLMAATVGAFLAGLLLAPRFSGPNGMGWLRTGIVFGGATVLGSSFSGPIYLLFKWPSLEDVAISVGDLATLFLMGPVFVPFTVFNSALALATWLGLCAMLHITLMLWPGARPANP